MRLAVFKKTGLYPRGVTEGNYARIIKSYIQTCSKRIKYLNQMIITQLSICKHKTYLQISLSASTKHPLNNKVKRDRVLYGSVDGIFPTAARKPNYENKGGYKENTKRLYNV